MKKDTNYYRAVYYFHTLEDRRVTEIAKKLKLSESYTNTMLSYYTERSANHTELCLIMKNSTSFAKVMLRNDKVDHKEVLTHLSNV